MTETRGRARLCAVRELSSNVRELIFTCDQGPLSFRAGQWINLFAAPSGQEVKRAYSLASPPSAATFSLAVTRVPEGHLSPHLHSLAPGDELGFDGPHGMFEAPPGSPWQSALLVATGTGLAPFRSMLLDAVEHGRLGPTTLLLGCRREEDILWRDELEALAGAHPQLALEVTLSRPASTWRGRRGYVQAHLAELVARQGRPLVYACGLSRMTNEVRRRLKEELGYDRRQIRTERYD